MTIRTGTETSGTIDDDEPPPSRPQADRGANAPTVAAADERVEDRAPVDLDRLADLLAVTLADLGAPGDAEVSLHLIDPSDIAQLKAEHLDGDGSATDVLSFPIDGVVADAELIGDVVLCPSVAAAQAHEHAGTVTDELALLIVHAALHLAGHDHAEDDERRRMWAAEEDLMIRHHGHPRRDPWRTGVSDR